MYRSNNYRKTGSHYERQTITLPRKEKLDTVTFDPNKHGMDVKPAVAQRISRFTGHSVDLKAITHNYPTKLSMGATRKKRAA